MKDPETTVKRRVVINAPQESVWKALEDHGLAALHLLKEERDAPMKEGSTHVWHQPEDPNKAALVRAHVTVVAPPRRIALMTYDPSSGLPDEPENYTSVDLQLAPEEDGRTLVTVEQGDFGAFKQGTKLAREAGNHWVEALIRLREQVEHEAAA